MDKHRGRKTLVDGLLQGSLDRDPGSRPWKLMGVLRHPSLTIVIDITREQRHFDSARADQGAEKSPAEIGFGGNVAVIATQQITQMRGGTQSHIMLGSDGHAYVVKFQNNPQHLRVLVNELVFTRLAQAVGLKVPEAELVSVPDWLIGSTAELIMKSERGTEPCKAGVHYGSRLVGGLMPGQRFDYLPEAQLAQVSNLHEFAGMLILDKWTCNSDGRQAVFHRSLREKRYSATFIDHGFCFNGESWKFSDAPLHGVYARNSVYRDVRGWDNFEPWLSRVETLEAQDIWAVIQTVPAEWLEGFTGGLEQLIGALFARRHRICDLINQFRQSSREPFPRWSRISASGVQRASLPFLMGPSMAS